MSTTRILTGTYQAASAADPALHDQYIEFAIWMPGPPGSDPVARCIAHPLVQGANQLHVRGGCFMPGAIGTAPTSISAQLSFTRIGPLSPTVTLLPAPDEPPTLLPADE